MKLEINTHFEVIETETQYIITGFDVYIGGAMPRPSAIVKYRTFPIEPGGHDSALLETFDAAFRDGRIRVFLTPEQQAS